MRKSGRPGRSGRDRASRLAAPADPLGVGPAQAADRRWEGSPGGARLARPSPRDTMFDRRRWARHGRAWPFLFAVAFLALSLFGYDPADPPGPPPSPPTTRPPTLAGRSGRPSPISCLRRSAGRRYLILFASVVVNLLRLPPPEGRRPRAQAARAGSGGSGRLGPDPEVRPGAFSRRRPSAAVATWARRPRHSWSRNSARSGCS